MYKIFTDGASKGNPGPGGWGAVVSDGEKIFEIGGHKKNTTNNEMELVAVIEALSKVPKKSSVHIYTDSAYVVNGITKWVSNWEKRDWKTLAKKDVLYREMWEKLFGFVRSSDVTWQRISGHSGLLGNERVDKIASDYADSLKPKLFVGDKKDYGIDIDDVSYSLEKKESKSRSKGKAYSYISSIKGDVKIHKTWKECEDRIKGVSGARFKKSLDLEDEKEIIRLFSK